jgi:predicted Zn-dependent protease
VFLAKLEFSDNNIDAARKILKAGIESAPNEPSLHGCLVDIELLSENPERAAEAAMEGLRRCPGGGGEKWAKLAALYYGQAAGLELQQGNPAAAHKIALDALELIPSEPVFYDILLRIEMAGGSQEQAAAHALRGIQNCPNGGNGLWHRIAAVYLLQGGERGAAREILNQGLKAFPNDPDLARLAGMA